MTLRQTATPISDLPIRVAFFTETFLARTDGIGTRLRYTIQHLHQLGHKVIVITSEGGPAEFDGADIVRMPSFIFPLYPEIKAAIPWPSIGNVLGAFRPDLIHALQPVLLGASAFYYSSARRVPLVVSHHTQLPRYLHYYRLGRLEGVMWRGIKSAYNRADLTLVTSDAMQAMLAERSVQRIKLWPRGVDTQLFHPGRASREMRTRLTQGHPEEKLVLYAGRLSAEKEIEQCKPILSGLSGVRLALVGDGPYRPNLEQHYAGTPTYFAGYLKGEELASAYASADVFLMPSRTETLGLVLLEAMASGCPAVAANAGGIADVVREGVTGRLYSPLDISGASAALSQLLGDSTYRDALGRQARAETELWSWENATRQLETFYRELMQRERELPRRISDHHKVGATIENTCESLQISRVTYRRHVAHGSVKTSPSN